MRRSGAPKARGKAWGRALAWVVAAGLAAGVAPADAETLRGAFATAYAESPRLAAARDELRAVREELPRARAGYLPFVGLEGSYTARDFESQSNLGVQDHEQLTTARAAAVVAQNLYAGGGTAAAVRAARAAIERAESRLLSVEQDLLLDVVRAYAAVLADQRILEAARANVARLEEQLEGTATRRGVGDATVADLAQAEARLAGARADLSQAEANLATSLAGYQRVVGPLPARLGPATLPPQLPASLATAVQLAEGNPELTAARAAVEQADADARAALAELLPSVDLEGELSYTDEPSIFISEQRDAAVGLSVDLPLYQGGAARAALRQERAVLAQRRRELAEAGRLAREQATSTFEELEGATERVAFFTEQTEAYARALEGVEREALIGTRLVLDVLDAQQELFSAQVSLERARQEQAVAAYSLAASIGGLTGGALNLPAPGPGASAAAARPAAEGAAALSRLESPEG